MVSSIRHAFAQIRAVAERIFAPRGSIAALAGNTLAIPQYDAEHAMSAIAAYPWVRVGVEAVAANLSQVPIVVVRDGEQVDDHWLLELLRRPEPSMGGTRWRRQIVADLRSTGNAFAVIGRDVSGRPVRLRRRHPKGWEPIVDDLGDLLGWRDGRGVEYSATDVWHVADISWQHDLAAAHLGESPIRPLDAGVSAALAARQQARRASERGRLEMLVTSKLGLAPHQTQEIADGIDDIRQNGSGTLVVGEDLEVHPLSLSARDTEFVALDERARVEAGAVLGVPPVRRQDPSANYGAAKQEMRQYWENLRAFAELIDEELTELVGEPGVVVRHSFEQVEALQTSYTERLNRVVTWVQLGATPEQAAAYERFQAHPLAGVQAPRVDRPQVPADPSLQVDTPQAQSVTPADRVGRAVQDAARWLAGFTEDPDLLTEPLTLSMLTLRLTDAGVEREAATEAASAMLEAAYMALHETDSPDLGTLPAFSPAHAAMLAQEAR